MINLLARLDFDGTPFYRGLSKSVDAAKSAGNKIGKEVGNDFAQGLKRTIGAGALAAVVVAGFRGAQEIRDQAAALGMTSQEFAAMELVAKKLGDTTNVTTDEFRRLTEEVIASGQIPSENVLTRMARDADTAEEALRRLRSQLVNVVSIYVRAFTASWEGIKAAWNGMSGSENAMQTYGRYREAFLKSWNDVPKAGSSIAERAVRTQRPEEKEKVKAEAESKVKAEKTERSRLGLPNTPFADRSGGSLAAIGLGPGRGGVFNLQRQMLEEQRRTTQALRTLPNKLAKQL